MSRSSTLIAVGVLTILLPFGGLPSSWLHVLYPLFGLIVVTIGFLMRADHVKAEREAAPEPPLINHDIPPIT